MIMTDKDNLKYMKFLFLFSFIILSFYRSPFIFLNGRFLAEEATSHFVFALQNNFFENLIYYDEIAGYYNLVPNLFTWISTNLKIENAPLATVYGSFLFIILLPYFCLFRDSILLDTEKKKIIGSFILFLSPPFVAEIWLNTINSQVYLCLISILILFMINLTVRQKIFNNILIFVSGLSGIYTCSLLPFFYLKYLSERNKYNLTNLIILVFTNIIQLFLIIKSKLNNTLVESSLTFEINQDLFVGLIYNFFTKPVMARQLTHFIWDNFSFLINNNYYLLTLIIITIILIFFFINFNKILSYYKKDKLLLYLTGIFVIISLIVITGSLNNQVGGRYAVIPGTVLLLIYLHLSSILKNLYLRISFLALITISLLTGFYEFRPPTENVKHQYLKYLDCISCPIWSEEVKKWRKDQSYVIGIWPYPHKNLVLNPNIINY